MRVEKTVGKADRGIFGQILRRRGQKGGHVTYFAEDNTWMGVGSTPAEAIADLRATRGRFAGSYERGV